MKSRIEVDEMGRTILILPEEVIEEFALEDGDTARLELSEDVLVIEF